MLRTVCLVLLFALSSTNAYDKTRRLTWGQGDCPKDELFSAECLEAALPPHPICQQRTAAEWVHKAVNEGYAHCCGEDLEECRCPQKNSAHFQGKIEGYCAGVEICKAQMLSSGVEGLEGGIAAKERLEVEAVDEEGEN